jgi:CHAD domain-containing protein
VYLADLVRDNWSRHQELHRKCVAKFTRKNVHRSRLQTRRLISLLDLLQGFIEAAEVKKMRRALKRRHAITSDLRDAQVGLKNIKRMAHEVSDAESFSNWLRKQKRKAHRKAFLALKRVKHMRLARLLDHVDVELRRMAKVEPAARAAKGILRNVDRAFARVARRDSLASPESPRAIHRTRVALKRFACIAEATSPLLPRTSAGRRTAMKKFLAAMGRLQDNEVLIDAFARFEQKAGARPEAIRAWRAALGRRRDELLRGYTRARPALSAFKPVQ